MNSNIRRLILITMIFIVISSAISTALVCTAATRYVPKYSNHNLTKYEYKAVDLTNNAIYVYDKSTGFMFIYTIDKNTHYPEVIPITSFHAGAISYQHIKDSKNLIVIGE